MSLKIEADLLTSSSGNNTNYWLVAIASLIVKNYLTILLCMNIVWTFPPHLICKNTPQFSQVCALLVRKYEQ